MTAEAGPLLRTEHLRIGADLLKRDIEVMDSSRVQAVKQAKGSLESSSTWLKASSLFPVEELKHQGSLVLMSLLKFHQEESPEENRTRTYYLGEGGTIFFSTERFLERKSDLMTFENFNPDPTGSTEFELKYLSLSRKAVEEVQRLLKKSADSSK